MLFLIDQEVWYSEALAAALKAGHKNHQKAAQLLKEPPEALHITHWGKLQSTDAAAAVAAFGAALADHCAWYGTALGNLDYAADAAQLGANCATIVAQV